MTLPPCPAAFFLTSTLAFVQISADGSQISTFKVYRGATKILRDLRDRGVRIGFIFHGCGVPDEGVRTVVNNSEIGGFGTWLLVVPNRPIPTGIFEAAAAFARQGEGCKGARLLFVGTEAVELDTARNVGFLTALRPEFACSVLHGSERLRYLRIRVPAGEKRDLWVPALRAQQVVPLHVASEPLDAGSASIYAVADTRTAATLDDLGFWVDRLGVPDQPETSTLYLIRDDLQARSGFSVPIGNSSKFFADEPGASQILASTHEGILAALPSDISPESLEFFGSLDSHTQKLSPSAAFFQEWSTVAERMIPLHVAAAADPLNESERTILTRHFQPEFMERVVTKYAELGSEVPGRLSGSRHIQHTGNRLAVEALVKDLTFPGPTVERHCFLTGRIELTNVIATLNASDKKMEEMGVVIVSAHLDSTAKKDRPYNARTDPAPGADDDASGMAAVLSAASAFVELALLGRAHREVRFVFFNAEEIDRSGSTSYATAQAEVGTQAAAVFHLDMIGYDGKPPACFEVHAGFPASDASNSEAARNRSIEQACLIEHLRPMISTLPKTEMFTDPKEKGVSRSDHASFHAAGYPACWVTQDFFPEEGPSSDRNPAYHTSWDKGIVKEYASEIGRLVAAAAWIAATR